MPEELNFQGSSSANARSQAGDVFGGGVQMGGGFFKSNPVNVGLIAGAVAIIGIALIIINR
jgi:hypothetical protein